MPQHQTQTETLARAIERSLLLSPERKSELLSALPTLTELQGTELAKILSTEDDILQDLAHAAITRAVERGDATFLADLEAFLVDATKRLRKAEEGAEVTEEQEQTEHLFDDPPTP